jgi:hypothetical protein
MKARATSFVFVIVAVAAVAGAPAGCGSSLGGATGTAGTTGAGGTTGGGFGEPKCPSTVAKGSACGPADIQFCYNPCGPGSIGGKTETCTSAGTYAEMTGCVFDPKGDYSCYRIPSAVNAGCPQATPPQAGAPCSHAPCMVCNSMGGVAGGQYLDSTGAAQVGYCVCPINVGTWACASDITWPCPIGIGC